MDRLKLIFEKQKELMEKIQIINYPVDINSREGQSQIREFAWWTVEELSESIDANSEADEHEELIDGLHFLTELSLLAGKDYNTISSFEPDTAEGDYLEMFCQEGAEWKGDFELLVTMFISGLGMLCNGLKNKPWKRTYTETNQDLFELRLEKVWILYFAIMVRKGLTSYSIADGYLRKQKVNIQRQENNY